MDPCLGILGPKMGPMFRDFFVKNRPILGGTSPYSVSMGVPPGLRVSRLKPHTPSNSNASVPPLGGVLSPKSYVDVPTGPRKSDYLYTNFLPNFPPISILFSKEKHSIWIKLGAFCNNLPKIHPICVIWAPSSLMKTPRSLYQILRKSAPKGRHIYVYHVNVRTPPGVPPHFISKIKGL